MINKSRKQCHWQTFPLCLCILCAQLEEAVGMGPYLPKKRVEAQPIVMTADRF